MQAASQARSQDAARLQDAANQGDRLLQLVTFTIANEEFGVEILKVQEIIRTLEITRVPRIVAGIDSEYISGVGKLNDRLLIMIDLNKLLSPEEQHGIGTLAA